jgi:hypothetical protein
MVERLAVNQQVVGSSPASGAISRSDATFASTFAFACSFPIVQ